MRISDLSRQTGVPIATIKFYLRERLLPPGTPRGRNQADYGDEHLQRLRLVRAFTGIGQMDLSSVRAVLAGIENEGLPLLGLYQLVDRAVAPEEPAIAEPEGVIEARPDVDAFIEALGWRVNSDAPGRHQLACVIAALQRLGCDCGVDFLTPYAQAAERLAAQELDLLPADGQGTDRSVAVVRSVLLEVALDALRRLAQEHYLTLRLESATEPRTG